jgi:hypothetical protein
MSKTVNLTPHTVRLISRHYGPLTTDSPTDFYIDFPSEGEARVNVETEKVDEWLFEMTDEMPNREWMTVPIKKIVFGEVIGLPEKKSGTQYIVSRLVKQAIPDRDDCFVPHDVVRDENGVIVGCLSLAL